MFAKMLVNCAISESSSAIKIGKDGARIEFVAPISEAEMILKAFELGIEKSFLVELKGVSEPISFWATFPNLSSAVKIGNERVKFVLEIPESEISAVLKIIAYARNTDFNLHFDFDAIEQ